MCRASTENIPRGIKEDLSACSWFTRLISIRTPIFPNLIHRIQNGLYQNANRFSLVEIDKLNLYGNSKTRYF
jgi:hypothetical protein